MRERERRETPHHQQFSIPFYSKICKKSQASSSSSSIYDYGKTIVDRIESLQFYKLFCWPSGLIQTRVSEVRGSKDRY